MSRESRAENILEPGRKVQGQRLRSLTPFVNEQQAGIVRMEMLR